MHNRHQWTQRTEDGEKREIRAVKFGKQWRIQTKLRSDEGWTYHDPALIDDLHELRDVLFRKYQRRRAAYEDVVLIEKMIADRTREEKAANKGRPATDDDEPLEAEADDSEPEWDDEA